MVESVRVSLASWLLEQIDADEKRCKDRKDGYDTWAESWHTGRCGWVIGELEDPCTCSVPARVLAECASKRKLIEWHGGQHVCEDNMVQAEDGWADEMLAEDGMPPVEPCDVMKLLALPYADQAGYRDEWAVSP